jgi:hypothetical protein
MAYQQIDPDEYEQFLQWRDRNDAGHDEDDDAEGLADLLAELNEAPEPRPPVDPVAAELARVEAAIEEQTRPQLPDTVEGLNRHRLALQGQLQERQIGEQVAADATVRELDARAAEIEAQMTATTDPNVRRPLMDELFVLKQQRQARYAEIRDDVAGNEAMERLHATAQATHEYVAEGPGKRAAAQLEANYGGYLNKRDGVAESIAAKRQQLDGAA